MPIFEVLGGFFFCYVGEFLVADEYKVRYVGEDAAEIRKGEIYTAHDLKDSNLLIGVRDRSGEYYAYPKQLFEKLEIK